MATARRPKKLDADDLWNYALRLLAGRALSAAELKRKLNLRAGSPLDVTPVMERLREYGFSDDRKFSESYAAARLANQGFGPSRVLRDLQLKQVPASVAKQAISTTFSGTDEQQLAEQYLLRRYRGKDLPLLFQEEKNLASAYRRLRLAGFSSAVTWKVLKRYRQNVQEWDETEELP